MGFFIERSQQRLTDWENVNEITQVSSREEFNSGQEAHVWKLSMDYDPYFYDFLTPGEKLKATRFRLQCDRHRYIMSHGFLRLILATYMNHEASTLLFNKGGCGKPYLISQNGETVVRFNMSYSKAVVCYIISIEHEVGIDIEYVKPNFDWSGIARLYYSTAEVTYLENLPSSQQVKAFLNLWTIKEALLKAEGIGLNGIEKMKTKEYESIMEKYSLIPFNYGEGYQGTLAICPEIPFIQFFNYKKG